MKKRYRGWSFLLIWTKALRQLPIELFFFFLKAPLNSGRLEERPRRRHGLDLAVKAHRGREGWKTFLVKC